MQAIRCISQALVGLWLVAVTSANTFALAQPSAASPVSPFLLAQANLAPSNSNALKPTPVAPSVKAAPTSPQTAVQFKTAGPDAANKAAPPALDTMASQTKPLWQELTPAQQQSLKPLAANWSTIGVGQKRKWLEVSKNYPTMSPGEQSKLHSRMSDWASMSQQQRNQARLNFAESKALTPDEKAANWKAYQALSPEEKQKFAAKAPATPAGAAAAVKPVPAQKMANVPSTRKEPNASKMVADNTPNANGTNGAKIDNRTLLPIAPLSPLASPLTPSSPARSPGNSPAGSAPQKP